MSALPSTANHPFWVEDQHAFIDAGSLRTGGLLRTSQGTYIQISAVTARTEWTSVYNLTVADLHTFYVGTTGILVHNINPVCDSTARNRLRDGLAATVGASPYVNGQAHHILGVAQFNRPATLMSPAGNSP